MARLRIATFAGIVFCNLFLVVVFIAWEWPRWWENINYERSPLTWWSSLQLVLIGLVCLGNALLTRVLEKDTERKWLWLALGLAFCFFAIDERFQLHERLRDGFLKPNGIGTNLPGIGAGDFLFLIFALIGLVVVWRLWRFMKEDRPALFALLAAVLIALVSVVMDAQPIDLSSIPAARKEQFTEELLETAAQMCFFVSFSQYALRLLAGARIVPK